MEEIVANVQTCLDEACHQGVDFRIEGPGGYGRREVAAVHGLQPAKTVTPLERVKGQVETSSEVHQDLKDCSFFFLAFCASKHQIGHQSR